MKQKSQATESAALLERLAYPPRSLSAHMQRIAEFLATEYQRAAFMSTRQIAAAAGVSAATVTRFARHLGYSNFEELRIAIEERISLDLTSADRLRQLPAEAQTSTRLLRSIVKATLADVDATIQHFDETRFHHFVGALDKAPELLIIGLRWVAALATYLAFSLNRVRPGVSLFTTADSTLFDSVHLIDQQSAVVLLSLARYTQDAVAIAKYARSAGRQLLLLTDNPVSPLVTYAGQVLYVRSTPIDFAGSAASPAIVLQCLACEVALRRGGAAIERLERQEVTASKLQYFARAAMPPTQPTKGGVMSEFRVP